MRRKQRHSIDVHLDKNELETNHMKVVDNIVQEEVKKIDEFNQNLILGLQKFK